MGLETAFAPLAGQVRHVLSGRSDGASQIAEAIAQPAGAPGWFTPADPIWTVHGSVATFLGGVRSLLLQALHPLALAGVDQHSTYRQDPFGRLQRTGAFIAATTFGSEDLAEQTIRAVLTMHQRVKGTAEDGRPYSAQDPRLLAWVHIALTDSMLRSYLDYGHDGPIDADGYVANMAVVADAMGVVDPPRTHAELTAQLEGFRSELRVDDVVRRTHGFIRNAPLPLTLKPGYTVLARAAWDSLPPWALEMLGSSPRTPRTDRALADAGLRVLGFAPGRLPRPVGRRAATGDLSLTRTPQPLPIIRSR